MNTNPLFTPSYPHSSIMFHVNICKGIELMKQKTRGESDQEVAEFVFKLLIFVFSISEYEAQGKKRTSPLVLMRAYFCGLVRDLTQGRLSFTAIGKYIGGREHSTIMWCCRKCRDMVDTEKKLASVYESFRNHALYGHELDAVEIRTKIRPFITPKLQSKFTPAPKKKEPEEEEVILTIKHYADPKYSYRSRHA